MNQEKYLRSNDYRLGYNDAKSEQEEAVEQIKGWTKYETRPQIHWTWALIALILGVIVSACIINVPPSINY